MSTFFTQNDVHENRVRYKHYGEIGPVAVEDVATVFVTDRQGI